MARREVVSEKRIPFARRGFPFTPQTMMAPVVQRSSVVAFILCGMFVIKCAFGQSVNRLVGDPVQFPVHESCESARLLRLEQRAPRPVSAREDGVCKPAEGYKDRVDLTSCFGFTRVFVTDTGEYELWLDCDGNVRYFSLQVVHGDQVTLTDGEPGRLPCYYKTTTTSRGNYEDSIRWRKDGQDVLVHDLNTRNTTYGLDFEKRVSLPSEGAKEGDWSLILDQVQLQDDGVYYCSALRKGVQEAWGSPAAVRLKVTKRNLDQTTPSPPLTSVPEERSWTFDGWTALLTFVIVALLFCLLGWFLKTRRCPGPGGGQYTQAKGKINGSV